MNPVTPYAPPSIDDEITFGKHRGTSYREAARKDPGYIAWAAKTIGGGQSLEPIDRPQQLIPKPAALGRGQPIEDVDVSAGRGGPALGPDQDCARRLGDEVLDRGLEVVDHPPSKRFSGGLSRVRTVSPSSYSTLTAFSPAAIAAAY